MKQKQTIDEHALLASGLGEFDMSSAGDVCPTRKEEAPPEARYGEYTREVEHASHVACSPKTGKEG